MNHEVRRAGVVFLIFLSLTSIGAAAEFPRSEPEAQGVSSADVLAFVDAADKQLDGMHSLMVVRHGKVVTEGWWTPYAAAHNHLLYSLSKSFTSTAVGFAVAEGKLSIDDEVLKFFPEDAPSNPSDNLKAMRVRDLLMMSAGHQDEISWVANKLSAKAFLENPVPHKPGTHFKYNTPATFMLSAIVQKQTGQTVLDYLRPRLFEPLGIEHPVWDANFQGISLGGYGLRVRTEDIARFGQLYLQRGKWQDRQLLPPEWIDLATSRQTSNGSNPQSDWDQGYGFQFWRCRHGAYRGDGAFGQYCIVLPQQDAVIAITSGVKDMQAVLNLVWDKLLPAFRSETLPADEVHCKQLAQKLGSLKLRTADGQETSPLAAKIAGRKFVFAQNDQKLESLTLAAGDTPNGVTLVTRIAGKESCYPCGYRDWKCGRGVFGDLTDEPVAGTVAWAADDTCVIRLCAYETPSQITLRLKFEGDRVTLSSEADATFGPAKRGPLTGKAE